MVEGGLPDCERDDSFPGPPDANTTVGAAWIDPSVTEAYATLQGLAFGALMLCLAFQLTAYHVMHRYVASGHMPATWPRPPAPPR